LVPGVLFSNRKIADEKVAIVDVAPTILKLFGLGVPGHFDGKAWSVAGRTTTSVSQPSKAVV
jgi:predicted AlkP superfamily phosphohydrolase/phosphomutase